MRWWELKKELQVCETMTPSYAVPVFRLKSLWGNPSFSMSQADKNFCKILDDQSKFTIFLTIIVSSENAFDTFDAHSTQGTCFI